MTHPMIYGDNKVVLSLENYEYLIDTNNYGEFRLNFLYGSPYRFESFDYTHFPSRFCIITWSNSIYFTGT